MNATLTSWLRDVSEGWADWMWHISWQVLLLVTFLTVIAWALRGHSARLRYALWLLILIRLVLPPATAFPTGYGWWMAPLSSHRFLVEPPGRTSASSNLAQGASDSAVTAASAPALSWSMILFLLWCGVLAVRLGMLLMAWVQVRSWVARAAQISDPNMWQMLREVQQKVGWHGNVDLRNSEACATPLVVGWLNPTVLLPRTILERLSPAEMEAVLVHELMHLKRRDGWIRAVQAVLESVYFFHPAVWWSNGQLRQLREDACDEATVATLGRRKAYGSALISAAEILGYAPPPLALGVLDSRHPIGTRVHRILDPSLPVAPIGIAKYLAVMLVAALILLPAGPKPANATPDRSALRPEKAFALPSDRQPSDRQPSDRQPLEHLAADSVEELPTPAAANDLTRSAERLIDPARRHQAVLELQALGSGAEVEVIRVLHSADTATRIAAYEVLAVIGGQRSKEILETAFLERTGPEQFAAQRALQGVTARVQSSVPRVETTGSSRLFTPTGNAGDSNH